MHVCRQSHLLFVLPLQFIDGKDEREKERWIPFYGFCTVAVANIYGNSTWNANANVRGFMQSDIKSIEIRKARDKFLPSKFTFFFAFFSRILSSTVCSNVLYFFCVFLFIAKEGFEHHTKPKQQLNGTFKKSALRWLFQDFYFIRYVFVRIQALASNLNAVPSRKINNIYI